MTPGRSVPDTDHVSRYCKPSTVGSDGLPLAAAFELRPNEEHLSVNWLEYLEAPDLDSAVDRVRQAFRQKQYRLRPNGRFATLNVGAARTAIAEAGAGEARVEHLPIESDRSYAGVFGYSEDDFVVAVELRALVGRDDVYPATSASLATREHATAAGSVSTVFPQTCSPKMMSPSPRTRKRRVFAGE